MDYALLSSYKIFKEKLEMESSINDLDFICLRNLARFRCGSTNIPLITGRYTGIPRDERFCTLCDESKLGDEYHMLFECSSLRIARTTWIPRYYTLRPSALKFNLLMNNPNKKIQVKLSKFCKEISSHF